MDETQIHVARSLFRARIDSLRNDILRCFWPITNPSALPGAPSPAVVYSPPQYAPFPAIMYCFATVDYFSSFWEGWNDNRSAHRPKDRNQSLRMMDFLCKFLRYPRKAAYLAISVWRHKLMHTSEPRLLRSTEPRVYVWSCGVGGSVIVEEVEAHHMRLESLPRRNNEDRSLLYFDCYEFVRDLEEGVFGPDGYFTALLANESFLQSNYIKCLEEMEQYKIDFSKVGL